MTALDRAWREATPPADADDRAQRAYVANRVTMAWVEGYIFAKRAPYSPC